MKQERIVPVSSLVLRIKTVLQQEINLDNIWIQGEVSNLVKHRSGHYYFSIKDETSELSCVMFSTYVRRLSFRLEEGMNILIKGSVSVYEQRGSLQLYVKEIKQDGMGNLFLEFEKRKALLFKEGYFDEAHKKKKPEWIENIAIVTAKEGAAIQDVVKTIKMRWPAMKMTLYPAYVQGNQAPASMIQALLKADQNEHDAILLVRGGGSFEDLFCFNDVELVKALYSLQTYVVTGVGHEVDTTLVDLVSDQRCVTPTAAGQWVSPDYREVLSKVQSTKEVLINRLHSILEMNKSKLNMYTNYPYFVDPHQYIFEKTLILDSYTTTLENTWQFTSRNKDKLNYLTSALQINIQKQYERNQTSFQQINIDKSVSNYITNKRNGFMKSVSLLDAYSPLKTLNRGYSIASKGNTIVRSIDQVDMNDTVSIRVIDGTIETKVVKKESNHG